VVDQQDAGAVLVGDRAHEGGEVRHLRLREARGGLVEEHERRLRRERACDAEPPLVAVGERRRGRLGVAVEAEPRYVLLDEPAAGLPEAEVPEFAAVVRSIRDDHGAGVLLIDHNMALIMDVCDRVEVLDQGRTLAAGTPAEIRENIDVGAAYLGESAVVDA
jgi:ABC-type branched-subunit amino acid transport system ATPase component